MGLRKIALPQTLLFAALIKGSFFFFNLHSFSWVWIINDQRNEIPYYCYSYYGGNTTFFL